MSRLTHAAAAMAGRGLQQRGHAPGGGRLLWPQHHSLLLRYCEPFSFFVVLLHLATISLLSLVLSPG